MAEPPILDVRFDGGLADDSAAQPRKVIASDERWYLIKGRTLSPGLPWVAANEWLCARLAAQLGIPVRPIQLLWFRESLVVGVEWVEPPTLYPRLRPDLLDRCTNREIVPTLLAFDTWVLNDDRRADNVMVVRHGKDANETLSLLPIDHSHCPIAQWKKPNDLAALVESFDRQLLQLGMLRECVVSIDQVRHAVGCIEAVADMTIQDIVQSIPEGFLTVPDRALVTTFLIERRDRVRRLIGSALSLFPNLQGGSL